MNHKSRITVAAVAVTMIALVAAGTTYARALSPQVSVAPAAIESEAPDQSPGCGSGAAGDMHSAMWESLAESLSLTTDQLNNELSSGKTLDKLAAEKGIGAETLAETMRAAMKNGLDKLVAEGKLTREKADAALDAAEKHMTPEHVASMGDMTGPMHGDASGSDMDAMHDGSIDMSAMHNGAGDMGAMHNGATDMGAMHGTQGAQEGGSCHDGSTDGGNGASSVPSTGGMMGRGMMGQPL